MTPMRSGEHFPIKSMACVGRYNQARSLLIDFKDIESAENQ